MSYTGVILVGGKGSRLKNLTKNKAKPLIVINDKPFLDYLIYYISSYNFKKIFLLCSYKLNQFFNRYHKKKILGVNIYCIREKKPLGTAGALLNLKNRVKGDFFLFNGDSYFPINLDSFYKFSKSENSIISLACTKNLNYKSNKKITNISIKNHKIFFQKFHSNIMNGGIYFIKNKFLKLLKKKKSSIENDHINQLIKKKQISGKLYNKYFIDIGIKKNLIYAKKTLIKNFSTKVAFLDRDGVINKDNGYVHQISKFVFLKGVKKGLKILSKNKYLIIIVTNQSGIGRKLYSENDFKKLSKYMCKIISKAGSNIDDIYYCPHHPSKAFGTYKKNCNCRKPKPGMILEAIKNWSVNKNKSFMIGDKNSDKIAAKKSNIKFFLKKKLPFNNQVKQILKYNFI